MSKNIEVLHVEVDEVGENLFRFLIDGKTVKYVTIAGGLFNPQDMCFAPTLLPLLPSFPDGSWNEGWIDRVPDSRDITFVKTAATQLPSIGNLWHSTFEDHLNVSFGKKLRTGVYEATIADHDPPVVAKFAPFPWQIAFRDAECVPYEWIEGRGIGPRFLGYLTEEGRVIGFFIDHVPGARHATPEDLPLCQDVLSRLHDLGILHGDVNKHNFLIQGNRAVLIDFEESRKTDDKSLLQGEMDRLVDELNDTTSGRGGCILGTVEE